MNHEIAGWIFSALLLLVLVVREWRWRQKYYRRDWNQDRLNRMKKRLARVRKDRKKLRKGERK